MNKRGGFTDMFVFIIIAFVLMVGLGIMIYAGTTAYTEIRSNLIEQEDLFEGQNATEVVEETLGQVPASYYVLYWGAIVLLVAMVISIFIGSYLVTTRPLFFVPYMIGVTIAIILSAVMSNVYEELIADPTLASTFANFVGANFFMGFLPIIVAVVGVIGGFIMFSSFAIGGRGQEVFVG
jgi:hypothetical protein